VTVKQCSYCMEFYPETDEFFYKANKGNNFRPECKYCFDYEQGIKKKKKKLQSDQEKWKEQYKDKMFTCTLCGKKKTFDQMRNDPRVQKVENRCKECWNKKRKEIYNKNWESRVYAQVLKERRELNNGTSKNKLL
jgi:transcription elongation factor Elf1